MRTELFRMPNGEITSDINLYAKSWKAMGEALEAKFGFVVPGFDPAFQIIPSADQWNGSFTLPLWAAKRLLES